MHKYEFEKCIYIRIIASYAVIKWWKIENFMKFLRRNFDGAYYSNISSIQIFRTYVKNVDLQLFHIFLEPLNDTELMNIWSNFRKECFW